MKKISKTIFLILSVVFIFSFRAFSWNGETHKLITEYAVRNSLLGNIELCKKLNLDKGLLQEWLKISTWLSKKRTILKWVQYGAENEDKHFFYTYRRYDNHFHNPLDPWNGNPNLWEQAGLDDWVWLPPDSVNIIYKHVTGDSSILWAQDKGENRQSGYPQGDQSWGKIREHYYNALISKTDDNGKNDERENYFARTFKGLGHQMHLIQDMSVPEHVRNDGHPDRERYEKFTIESWAENDITEGRNLINSYAQKPPVFPDLNLNITIAGSLVPITQLTDINIYDGTNPSDTNQQGLAEYINSNFFSEDTIFTSEEDDPNGLLRHRFPYPRKASTNLQQLINDELLPEEVEAEDGKRYRCWWIKKTGHGEITDHILAVGYLEKYVREKDNKTLYRRTFYKNWLVHNDYTEKLVPRAVGYSAALIDYFFRGEIEITLPASPEGTPPPQKDGIYAFSNDNDRTFKEFSLGIKNITPFKEGEEPEDMKDGVVVLVVRYRPCDGNPFELPIPVPDMTKQIFAVSEPIHVSGIVPRDKPKILTFDLSKNPIPIEATDVNLTVVFSGCLGREMLSAVAIGFKDIGEPTPIDLFNNSDLVCFNDNYVDWLDGGLWQLVDLYPEPPDGPDGKIDCLREENITPNMVKPMYISFNGNLATEENYYYKVDHSEGDQEIFPGKKFRFYVLANDAPETFNFSVSVHSKTIEDSDRIVNPNTCLSYYETELESWNTKTNKLIWNSDPSNPHYDLVQSTMGTFRGIYYFNLIHYENNEFPEGSVCSINALTQSREAYPHIVETSSGKKYVVGAPQKSSIKSKK